MKVRLATPRRANPTSSLRAYARRALRSLRSVPEGTVELYEIDVAAESRWGGILRPLWHQLLHSFPKDGSIWHATEPNAALRGADVLTVHDLYMFGAPGAMMRLSRWSTKLAIRRARRIVVQTEVAREELRRAFGERVWEMTRVVPPAFETVTLARPAPVYDVAWIGNLDRRKRPDLFLDGLRAFPGPRLRVAFLCHRAGYGEELPVRQAYERACQSHDVEWIDRVLSEAELDRLYQSTRTLVSTSTLEGFHAPVTEAWMRGTRVVLPNIPVYREIYGSVDGVRFYSPETGFQSELSESLAGGPFQPDPELVRSLSDPALGRRLWAVYEELVPSPAAGT